MGTRCFFSLSLSAGIYYLKLDGTGRAAAGGGDEGYSDYGSLGQYTITGTSAFCRMVVQGT